jgi:uncharacterized protein YqiB (DUF1249 family)
MSKNFQTIADIARRQSVKRQRYCPDLSQQMAMAAANYHRLQRLLGDFTSLKQKSYQLGGGSAVGTELTVKLIQRFTYTMTLELRQPAVLCGSPDLVIMVRLYHDMRLAEVVQPTGFSQYRGLYGMPDPNGYGVDEKAQLNRLLAEWLQQCLDYGLPVSNLQPGVAIAGSC